MFSSSLVFTRKGDGELCRCYLDCTFCCALFLPFPYPQLQDIEPRESSWNTANLLLYSLFLNYRIQYKGTGSILNAFSQDTFVVGCYNLIEECKDDWRSAKSSHSSLSSMKKDCGLEKAFTYAIRLQQSNHKRLNRVIGFPLQYVQQGE